MYCSICKGIVSIKDTERWVSLKCKCKCSIYYSDGHFRVVSKETYLKNKEKVQYEQGI